MLYRYSHRIQHLHIHNLKDYELGALLAAITFCNKYEKCYHSLGYAKPFGYGNRDENGDIKDFTLTGFTIV